MPADSFHVITPARVLLFLLAVLGLAGVLMAVVPANGWTFLGLNVRFPTWAGFLEPRTAEPDVTLEDLFAIYAQKGDHPEQDSLRNARRRLALRQFQFPQGDSCVLEAFFTACALDSRTRRVRILHYGDSQIEGDRITGLLNDWFQAEYGGQGPGWIPVVEIIPTDAAGQEASDNWIRYTRYGGGPAAGHNRFGLLGAFSRFTPVPAPSDSLDPDANEKDSHPQPDSLAHPGPRTAWFEIRPARGRKGRYDRVRLAWGDVEAPVSWTLHAGEREIDRGTWLPAPGVETRTWTLGSPPPAVRFSFEGVASPNFTGVSLESGSGVYVDNIPLRGSSGTEFTRIQTASMVDQIGDDKVAMVIYQFGGNTLPSMETLDGVNWYGGVVAAQLRRIRALFPGATLLVIGPSDMSVKDQDRFVTYPLLPAVRDAIREAAFREGAVFWDMYEVMGGQNSMPQWVAAEPALATTDYTHFTPEGARYMSEWLIDAFRTARQNLQMDPLP